MVRFLCAAVAVLLTLPLPALAQGSGKKGDGRTLLKITVEPPSKIFVDGKPRGGGRTRTLELTPGAHIIRVVHNRDEHEERVVLKRGETTEWSWKFEDAMPAKAPPKQDEGAAGAEGAAPGDAPAEGGDAPADAKTEMSPIERIRSAEPKDPPPDNPRRNQKVRPPKKDPLEGIDAPPQDPK